MADAAISVEGISPGDLIAERYEVESVLGKGGMGIVVSAMHLHLRERVAIKLLLPTATHADAVARFIREARAASKIKNEHVARVTDVGMLASGQPYMVMELLEGEDLSFVLARRGTLPPEEAVELVLQVCEAIAVAHALGVVHRDLKPANLFLVRNQDGIPFVKVLDFGISKMTGPDMLGGEVTLTRSVGLMGSPLYMSPEQVRSPRNVDARSDIWSLGIILYQLCTGSAPFTGQTIPELSVKIAVEPTPPLPPMLPESLARVIYRCLSKDREQRFQSVADLAEALAPLAPLRARHSAARARAAVQRAANSSQPNSDAADQTRVSGSTPPATKTLPTVSISVRSPSPRRFQRPLYAAAAVLALVGSAWLGARLSGRDATPHSAVQPTAAALPALPPRPGPPAGKSEAKPGPSPASPATQAAPVAPSASVPPPVSSASARGRKVPAPPRTAPAASALAPPPTPQPSATVEPSPFDRRKW